MESQQILMLIIYTTFFCFMPTSSTITPNQSLQYHETLVSSAGTFEAGFFDFGNSRRQYFGIWYKSILPRTIVWVANRNVPAQNSTAVLKLTHQGDLVILDGSGGRVWSSNSSKIAVKPVVQLLDSGNLVVKDGESSENFLWESFDYPGDTFLAGMKLKSDFVTGPYQYLTSWRDNEDPAEGEFYYKIDTRGFPQQVTTKGTTIFYSTGPWNGYLFSGVSWDRMHRFLNFSFELTNKGVTYGYETLNSSVLSRTMLKLNPRGGTERFLWSNQRQSWDTVNSHPIDQCEYFGTCGVNSICNINKLPICECLQGFTPKFLAKWDSHDWSGGCVRRTKLSCDNGDWFKEYRGIKFPETSSSWFDRSLSLEECETLCFRNCSCTAYANSNIRDGGSGCLLWFGDLVDLRTHTDRGQEIHIRMPFSERDQRRNKRDLSPKRLAGIIVGLVTFIVGLTVLVWATSKRIKGMKLPKPVKKSIPWKHMMDKEGNNLPTMFNFSTIDIATNHFSNRNKLGEGGFGTVHKGTLIDGQEIAVKRLSKTSRQGTEEFKNEVKLMATLQHRNLVKLLGCSIQQDEKLLIYEFMPNRSLDYFIFDTLQGKSLDWTKRLKIIDGIARGLMYLHQDSRLRIIHRDIKTSNILLDDNMIPKISDFGLARIFGADQAEANTNRVMGTHGYMPPEYAGHGCFSTKSDVFSFGVIVIEIISGRKNRGFRDPHHHLLNLLGHVSLNNHNKTYRNTMESQQILMLIIYTTFFCFMPTSSTITPNQSLQYHETLVSSAGTFEAGFFDFGNSRRQYFGIWYKSILPRTIVWVANRNVPAQNSTAVLKLTHQGDLVILDGSGGRVWSSNSSKIAVKPVVQLLDSGNLVVKDGESSENFLWESFDYPGDTFLAGMKLKSDFVTGPYQYLTSWRDNEDPAEGEFYYKIDTRGFPQQVTTKGTTIFYSTGPWNGYLFSGVSWDRMHRFLNFSFELTNKGVTYGYETLNSSVLSRTMLKLNPRGGTERFLWSNQRQSWDTVNSHPIDQCEYFGTCGVNSICNINKLPICECLQGFTPKFLAKWDSHDWSGGCVRRTKLSCDNGDWFKEYRGIKFPETSSSWFDRSLSLEECETLCFRNCSCTAYANSNIRDGGSGCLLWFGDLVDLRTHTDRGQEIHIRMPFSERDQRRNKRDLSPKRLAGIIVGLVTFIVGLTVLVWATSKRIKGMKLPKPVKKSIPWKHMMDKEGNNLPTMFNFSTIDIATNHFSNRNKLGEGGFGTVHKGTLIDGQEIAVKRLSKTSRQGTEEFKNEVKLMATLQHRNLVKLLGCSIQQDEKLLIYEFMPNRSLDYFIFDTLQGKSLDWTKRLKIIDGIARGLMYLHQDSRLRIIHRDIKTSNILLDDNMIPKISDFGLARIFGADQAEANTNRVMGTHGYMPPEYAGHGCFSTKSDVFSFGVIVIEIISGRKNRGFRDPHHHLLNLLGHAWRLWNEERPLELMDEILDDGADLCLEILRCIHVVTTPSKGSTHTLFVTNIVILTMPHIDVAKYPPVFIAFHILLNISTT
ncbi:serine/threonine-protein kinase PBS1 [Vigna unguiculata]|uniref:non-specific serine/threonine protein kinase n=1 Tax=Vigna unguiculata TaxID=3917 RepID=A0A4D6M334_VIGUN|nr:serine/threonine-protein kinase PBS1 [Vigna unguiculata]